MSQPEPLVPTPEAPAAPLNERLADAYDIDSFSRAEPTLRASINRFHDASRRAGELLSKYVDRLDANHRSPEWLSPPAGVMYGLGALGAAMIAPEIGVDLFGTSAALMPSKDEFGSAALVFAASFSIGAVLTAGAVVAGILLASAVHMRNVFGRIVAASGVLALCLLFNHGINKLGHDRENGLNAAALLQRADGRWDDADDISSKITNAKAKQASGTAPAPTDPSIQALEERRDKIEAEAEDFESQAVNAKSTSSLTEIQRGGFLAALIAGALFELGAMTRLRGQIERARGKADAGYDLLVLKAQAVVAVPRLKSEGGIDVRAKAQALLEDLSVTKPTWDEIPTAGSSKDSTAGLEVVS